jgi:hypothetical protein
VTFAVVPKYPIHHRIPQKASKIGLFPAEEVDNIANMRAVPEPIHNQITKEWGRFWADHPNVSKQDVYNFADYIDGKYGQYFWQP